MKKNEVKIGSVYTAKVSDRLVGVRIDGENRHGGWDATNLSTGKKVRIKSPARLRGAGLECQRRSTQLERPARLRGAGLPRSAGEGAGRKAKAAEAATAVDATATETAPEATPSTEPKPAEPKPAKPKPAKAKPATASTEPKKMSGLDAAAQVLAEADEPLTAKQIVRAAEAKGYWKSPGGKTPHATVYSAIIREIATKGEASRFFRTARGLFMHS